MTAFLVVVGFVGLSLGVLARRAWRRGFLRYPPFWP